MPSLMRIMSLWLIGCLSHAAIIEGDPNGTTSITLIYDYQCPYCHMIYQNIMKLSDDDPKIKIRLMPVAIINQTSIQQAAYAISATHYPDRFQAINHYLLVGSVKSSSETDEFMRGIDDHGIKIMKESHTPFVLEQLLEAEKKLQKTNRTVPIVIIKNSPSNVQVLSGYQSYHRLQAAVWHGK